MNNQGKCKGTSCSGDPVSARIFELQFATVDHGVEFVPKPTIKDGEEYNLEENEDLPKRGASQLHFGKFYMWVDRAWTRALEILTWQFSWKMTAHGCMLTPKTIPQSFQRKKK